MSRSTLISAFGVLLVLVGIFIPSSALVEYLRTNPVDADLLRQLLLGATLFKFGLVILGLIIIVLSRISIWSFKTHSTEPIPDPHCKFNLAILVAILFSAVILRLYGLDEGLWLDEILTYVNYAKIPFGEILTTYDSQNQHFLYSLLAHGSFLVFGESGWSLRLPAVLFGVGSILALYLLGCQVSSKREALFSAALLTFSYHHIWFSQNARGYTGLLFWTLLASWLFLRGLREARSKFWLLYAVTAALGVYSHMTMLFVVVGHFIIYLVALFARRNEVWHGRWTGFFLGFCLAGFFTLQLHSLVLPQIFSGIVGEGSAIATWKNPLWTVLEFVKGMEISFTSSVAAVIALMVFGAGFLSYARTSPVVIQLLMIPALVGAAVTVGMGHHLWPRFFFFTVGFAVLVTVRGAMLLGNAVAQRLRPEFTESVPLGAALCGGLVLLSAASIPFAYAPKQDYLGALAFVEEEKNPDDAIVTVGLATFPYKHFYKVNWEAVETVEALDAIRSRSERTWLLYTLPIHMQSAYPELMTSIQRDFKVVKEFYGTLGGGTIFICQSNLPPSSASTTDVDLEIFKKP